MNAVLSRALPHTHSMPVVLAVLTVASAAGVLTGPPAAAVPAGMLLGFVLPGLALTALIFRHRTLSAVERTVLAPALSLAVLIIAGLILYVAGFSLDRTSWTLAAAGVTLTALALKAVPERVWRGEADDTAPTELDQVVLDGAAVSDGAPVPPGPFAPWATGQKVTRIRLARQLTPMMLVVAILAVAGYLSFASSSHSYDVTVTTLSATPPGVADASGQRAVYVSATGLVADDGPYTVVVTDADGTRLVERPVPVTASGTWEARLRLPADERLTVGLLRAGDTAPYRTLHLSAQE